MASTIKSNTVTNSTGSTLTLGESGTTVTLACGATQSGFGRTGTVDWCTTVKTSPLTAVSGKGYFVNTTGGVITVTLPSSPSAGDIVSLKDYAGTWDDNAVTVGRAGSKINGACACATLNTESQAVTLIYVDGIKGWQDIQDSTSNVTGTSYVTATGGSVTTSGDYKIHTFTADANFIVSCAGNASGSDKVSYMVIGGGGAGSAGKGSNGGGGGGAGGFREGKCSSDPYTDSPLDAGVGLSVPAATYPITVGGGGAGVASGSGRGSSGAVSTFSTITSAGGGAGGAGSSTPGPRDGANGGSGGGKAGSDSPGNLSVAGTGNTPPVSPPQGSNGGGGVGPPGVSGDKEGFGGGGATGVGGTGGNAPCVSGAGGTAATTSINATPTARAGGGSGGAGASGSAGAVTGGGGAGGYGTCVTNGNAGTANTGGGGGGGANGTCSPGYSGGSGIVIIRYKYQN